MSKVSHHEAKYGCGDDKKHCSNCTMYRAASVTHHRYGDRWGDVTLHTGTTEFGPHCTKVEDPIEPYGVCKFWYPKK